MDGQDWAPVVLRGTKPTISTGLDRVVRQATKPQNVTPEAAAARRLEQQGGPQKPKELTTAARTEMMQRRAAMKKTQVELNQMCQFPANTVNGIESGKIIPNTSQLSKLNRVLGAKLVLT
jgi:ribosome-binding protein aMBF1 (putative translation factor)